jgi:hypothetical protein
MLQVQFTVIHKTSEHLTNVSSSEQMKLKFITSHIHFPLHESSPVFLGLNIYLFNFQEEYGSHL